MVKNILNGIKIVIVTSLFLIILTQVAIAIQTQALTEVNWEDLPSSVQELENYTLEIDFDFTSSSLQNYTIQYDAVTILNITNPAGCIIDSQNITCASNLEPQIVVNTTVVDENTTFAWYVYTNDAESGAQTWPLNLTLVNSIEAPQIVRQNPSNYSIFANNSSFLVEFNFSTSNYSLANATLFYQISSSHQNKENFTNTTAIALECNINTSQCNTTLTPASIMNFTANEFFFNSYIQVLDIVGNQRNDSQLNFFIDTKAPSITLSNPYNTSFTNQELINFTVNISDNSLSLASSVTEYPADYNCTLLFNQSEISQIQSNSSSISFSYNVSSFPEGTYNWSASCEDQTENFNISTIYSLTRDQTTPNITSFAVTDTSSSDFTVQANTSELSNITIFYGTNYTEINQSYLNASSNSQVSFSLTPSVTASSLSASTLYFYQIQICDQAANCAVSNISNHTTNAASVPSSSPSGSSSGGGGGGGGSGSSGNVGALICAKGYIKVGNSCQKIEKEESKEEIVEEREIIVQEETLAEQISDIIENIPNNQLTGAAISTDTPLELQVILGMNIFLLILVSISGIVLLKQRKIFRALQSTVQKSSKGKNVEINTEKFGNWFETHPETLKKKKRKERKKH